jgi:hypothetical protein
VTTNGSIPSCHTDESRYPFYFKQCEEVKNLGKRHYKNSVNGYPRWRNSGFQPHCWREYDNGMA